METRMKNLKERMSSTDVCIGTFCQIGHPETVEIVAAAGFDFAILDMEHGHFGIDVAGHLLRAAEARGLSAVIRVPENRPSLILQALDLGAAGVLIPQVSNRRDVEAAVRAAKYYPHGDRGACPFVRATDHYTSSWDTYSARANDDTLVMVLLEGGIDAEALDEIVATPGLDAVMIGPFDLSVSLGIGGQLNHPLILERIQQLATLCTKHGVALCIPAFDADLNVTKKNMETWQDTGCSNFCIGTDRMFFSQHLKSVIKHITE